MVHSSLASAAAYSVSRNRLANNYEGMSQWIFLRCAPWNTICQLGSVERVGLFIYFVCLVVDNVGAD